MALLLPNYPLPRVPNTLYCPQLQPNFTVEGRAVFVMASVCHTSFHPWRQALRLPGFGLQASGFPISITNLSAFLTILDSLNFHLEKMEVKIIKFNLEFNTLANKNVT